MPSFQGDAVQSEPAHQARELMEKLRSEKIEEREAATQALRVLGDRALDSLRKAQNDPDPEIRGRLQGLIAEFELVPLVPLWFLPLHADGLSRLRSGRPEERRTFVEGLLQEELLPSDLAEWIVLHDPDPEVRVAACWPLLERPLRRSKEAYFRLLGDFQVLSKTGRVGIGPSDEWAPAQEAFLEALLRRMDHPDTDRVRQLLPSKNGDTAGIAELLLIRLGEKPSRERLREIVENTSYAVGAVARQELARHFGPDAFRGLPFPRGTIARWHTEEAAIKGLLANGSPEAIEAVEKHAENLKLGSYSQAAYRLIARAGTEKVARALMDRALSAQPDYMKDTALDALRSMPPGVVLKLLQEEIPTHPELLVRFTSLILHQGDEEIVTAYFRVKNAEPANLHHWAPPKVLSRPEVTRACKRIIEESCAPWAIRYAYLHLSRFDPDGRAIRAAKVLKAPQHPAFPEALADFPILPEADREDILPRLIKILEDTDDRATVYALGQTRERRLIEPLRRRAQATRKDSDYSALYALVDTPILTDAERLAIARETGFSYFWDSLQGRLPRESWDSLRLLADKSELHIRVPIAQALVASGDTRPFASLKELTRHSARGFATVRVLTEGEDCIQDLMSHCLSSLQGGETEVAGEIMMALSAFQTPAVEAFLMERLEAAPIPLQRSSTIFAGFHPENPPADAIRALVNLRSERYRKVALRVSRTEHRSASRSQAVEALGTLNIERGLDEVVSWLEAAMRAEYRSWDDVPYLNALAYLGSEKHVELARGFLRDAEVSVAAARTLDRLVHRDHYRRLAEVRTLRRVNEEDPAELPRFLMTEWGLEVRLPYAYQETLLNRRSFDYVPVHRVDGFQILDRISRLLHAAPLWKDGHVKFLGADAAVRYWSEKK